MRKRLTLLIVALMAILAILAAACGDDSDSTASTSGNDEGEPAADVTEPAAETTEAETTEAETTEAETTEAETTETAAEPAPELPRIVVTTNILGDLVGEMVGELADVEVIMSLGSDPHDFAPSARQAESMENADLLIVNGAGFEEGMLDVIANVEGSGTQVFAFADEVELIKFTGDEAHDHEEGADHAHDHEEGADEAHDHEEGGDDPHIWTDPARMATAVAALGETMASIDGIDADALSAQVNAYVDELNALDAELEETLSVIADDQRILVTNHEVFGYFADRYVFAVVGAVIPSLTTNAEASASDITELAELIAAEGVPAIFADNTQSTQLAEAIADEAGGDVEVVELFSESLGDEGSGGETYITMMQANARLIADALA